jgi:RND family efflux transporter MFP subunit
MVKQGDELASIYSPDLVVTVQSLLRASKNGNQERLKDARSRLELLGIDAAQIEELLRTGQSNTHLKIRSPISGHVIEKLVREGDYVEQGTPLYKLADLSTVWIQGQVYEDDIALLPVAQAEPHAAAREKLGVVATTRAFPNEEFHGTLKFVYPHVDQATRTLTVRFEIDNPDHKLRPGGTATVRLHLTPQQVPGLAAFNLSAEQQQELAAGRVLAVPRSAVIDTGDMKVVYRQASPGEFEGVRVSLGPKMTNPDGVEFYPVLAGLAAGDEIVTSGSFLIDAETRLNPAAGSIYFGGSAGAKSSPASGVRATTPEDPDAKIKASLAKLAPADRALAEQQRTCPILPQSRLGSMGTPVKLKLAGETVFLCCGGCQEQATKSAEQTAQRARDLRKSQQPAGKTNAGDRR